MNGRKETIIVREETKVPETLASILAGAANEAITTNGRFVIGLSGGSMAKFVSNAASNIQTGWSKWMLFFCDERMVPSSDSDSTFKLYKEGLIATTPLTEDQFFCPDTSIDVREAAKKYEITLRKHFPNVTVPVFDMLLLGMGPDGHTASLFPGHPLLNEKIAWIAPISDSPKPPPSRITMTFPVINAAKCCLFAATGIGKSDMVYKILGEKEDFPTTRVSPQHLIWILDEAAASKLPKTLLQ